MSYIVEYTTLSGKRIPILHKIFETAEHAEAFGESGVSSGNYKDYAVVEQDDEKTLEKIEYHKRMNARHIAFANQAHEAGNTELRDQHKEAAKQHRRAQLDYEDGSPRAAQRSMDANIMSGLIIEAAPKMKGDWLKAQREKDRAHADAMGRHVKSGRKKSYTSTQRSLAQLRGEELPEGTDLDEAAAKIACVQCDEVSTAAAWKKNNGFCPKCKTSSQGVAESINEAPRGELDEYMADELKLYGENHSNLYRQRTVPIQRNLSKKWNKGVYNHELAVKLWKYWADDAALRYAKEFGGPVANVPTRLAVAKMMADDWQAELEAGNTMESVNEDISAEAHHMERDHEVQMARSDLYKTANYAIKLHSILKGISEEQGLEGWMQAKITKASDYLSSVYHALEYDELERSQSEPMPAMEGEERPYVAVHVKKGKTEVTGTSSYDAAKKAAAKWKLKSTAGVDVYLADVTHTPTESVEEGFKIRDKSRGYGVSDKTYKTREEAKKAALMKMASTGSEWEVIKESDTPTESVEEGMTASQHRQKMMDKIKKSGAVKSGSMSKDEEKVDETTTAGAIATAPMPMGKMIKRKKK